MSSPQAPVQNPTFVPIKWNPAYVRTVSGLLKIVCMVLNLLAFICAVVSKNDNGSRGQFFRVFSLIALWVTFSLLLFHTFHVIERYSKIPWMKIEMCYCFICTLLFLIAASLAAAFGSRSAAYAAAAFFGFCSMLVYGYDGFFIKFKNVRNGVVADSFRPDTEQPLL